MSLDLVEVDMLVGTGLGSSENLGNDLDFTVNNKVGCVILLV